MNKRRRVAVMKQRRKLVKYEERRKEAIRLGAPLEPIKGRAIARTRMVETSLMDVMASPKEKNTSPPRNRMTKQTHAVDKSPTKPSTKATASSKGKTKKAEKIDSLEDGKDVSVVKSKPVAVKKVTSRVKTKDVIAKDSKKKASSTVAKKE